MTFHSTYSKKPHQCTDYLLLFPLPLTKTVLPLYDTLECNCSGQSLFYPTSQNYLIAKYMLRPSSQNCLIGKCKITLINSFVDAKLKHQGKSRQNYLVLTWQNLQHGKNIETLLKIKLQKVLVFFRNEGNIFIFYTFLHRLSKYCMSQHYKGKSKNLLVKYKPVVCIIFYVIRVRT